MGKEPKAELGDFGSGGGGVASPLPPTMEKGKGRQMAGLWGKINALWAA